MLKLFFILGTILTFNSCMFQNCKQVLLSNEDMQLLDVYNLDSKIVFKSDRNQFDTLIIDEKDHFLSKCNKIEFGNYQYDQANIEGSVVRNGKIKYRMELYFSKQLQKSSKTLCSKYFTVFDLVVDKFNDFEKSFIRDTVILGSKVFNTYYRESGNKSRQKGWGKIKSFHWSKEFGLTRYTTKQNEIFTYYKRIN